MNETVTIPRGEYERLMQASEDLADLIAYDSHAHRLILPAGA